MPFFMQVNMFFNGITSQSVCYIVFSYMLYRSSGMHWYLNPYESFFYVISINFWKIFKKLYFFCISNVMHEKRDISQ